MSIPETFTLKIEKGKAGLWYVTSPEVKGLFFGGHTPEETLEAVIPCMRDLGRAASPAGKLTEQVGPTSDPPLMNQT